MSNQLSIPDIIFGVRNDFEAMLSDKRIIFDREAEFAIQIIEASPYLQNLARNNRKSLADAVRNIAAIGISLNPATKQAYLIPRKGAICLDISYQGLIDLATTSGSIRFAQARIVYTKDSFRRNGIDREPTHEYDEFSEDRGDAIGAYVVVKTRDSDYLTETMRRSEIYAIRDRSESFKTWQGDNSKKTPWVTDEYEMWKKTVVKRASKYWPSTERLAKAIHYLNTEGGEGLEDIQNRVEPPPAGEKFMGQAEVVTKPEQPPEPQQLPQVDDAKVGENLPKWHRLIRAGKKTADDIIAMIETKNSLTDSQKDRIRNVPQQQPEQEQ